MSDPSVAWICTDPPSVVVMLDPEARASTVLPIEFSATEPAIDTLGPAVAASAPDTVNALIVADVSAAIVTSPLALNVDVSTYASVVLPTVFLATDAPTAIDAP